MKLNVVIASIGLIAVVAACAQQEETTTVAPQPTFDKYGNGSCEDGWVYVPGATFENPCVPDDCDAGYDSAGNSLCPPPTRIPEGGDDTTTTARPVGTAARP